MVDIVNIGFIVKRRFSVLTIHFFSLFFAADEIKPNLYLMNLQNFNTNI